MGCALSVPAKVTEGTPLKSGEPLPPPPLVSSSPRNSGQMLPISALAEIGGQQIMLEVAQTPEPLWRLTGGCCFPLNRRNPSAFG